MGRQFKRVVGIDPGLTGAVALNAGKESAVVDLPIVRVHSKGYVNAWKLRELLLSMRPDLIVVELQGVMQGQGISSSGQTMLTYGGIVATAMTVGCTLEIVAASKWKRSFDLIGCGKHASLPKALKQYPKLKDNLRRKKDHNRADALLIASWGTTVH